MQLDPTEEEVDAVVDREDSIWLSLSSPNGDYKVKRAIVDWNEVEEKNGDYGDINSIIVINIPIYNKDRSKSDLLTIATQYLFNQIEILKRSKHNKERIMSFK